VVIDNPCVIRQSNKRTQGVIRSFTEFLHIHKDKDELEGTFLCAKDSRKFGSMCLLRHRQSNEFLKVLISENPQGGT
jgi:hypothetical protein